MKKGLEYLGIKVLVCMYMWTLLYKRRVLCISLQILHFPAIFVNVCSTAILAACYSSCVTKVSILYFLGDIRDSSDSVCLSNIAKLSSSLQVQCQFDGELRLVL